MRLNKLKVQRFKRIDEVELELSDVTILVGENSAGKSSILQAAHLAACLLRQAEKISATATSVVRTDELDYLPTESYNELGFRTKWGKLNNSPSSLVTFTFGDNDGNSHVANCTMRASRNQGISVLGSVPAPLTSIVRSNSQFLTSYSPGLSGIPNKEERKGEKVVLKSCSFGDSNVILRNVLHLLSRDAGGRRLREIQEWMTEIIGPITFPVQYREKVDLQIDCTFSLGGISKPIELLGTGYLQLLQLFSYIQIFSPKLLLIDEPDVHLHPSVQEKLIPVLTRIAAEKQLRVLITTHSPFVLRGSLPQTRTYWISAGKVESNNPQLVQHALGWGAFGKRAVFLTEDTNQSFLKHLLSQWPNLESTVAVLPGVGYQGLPNPDQCEQLSNTLGGKFRILVHRDRDSMTAQEVGVLKQKYSDKGAHLWVTDGCNIESYFCASDSVAFLEGCTVPDADQKLDAIYQNRHTMLSANFNSHRDKVQKEFYAGIGGSPLHTDVRTELELTPLKGWSGKLILAGLRQQNQVAWADTKLLGAGHIGLAPDLKVFIENSLL